MKHYRRERKNEDIKDGITCEPLQIVVNGSFEEAVRKFKSLFQKEKVVAKFKEKQSYEKPSEKKRRKRRESAERRALIEQRERLIASGEWEKRQQKRAEKRQNRIQKKQVVTEG